MIGLKNEEILTCLMLVLIGYFMAKMFSRSCNGFSVGGQPSSPQGTVTPPGTVAPQCNRQDLHLINQTKESCSTIGCGFSSFDSTCKVCSDILESECNSSVNCRFDSDSERCIFNDSGAPAPPPSPPQCTQSVKDRLNNMPGGQLPLESECQNIGCGFSSFESRCKECEEHGYGDCNNIHNCRFDLDSGQCSFNDPVPPPSKTTLPGPRLRPIGITMCPIGVYDCVNYNDGSNDCEPGQECINDCCE